MHLQGMFLRGTHCAAFLLTAEQRYATLKALWESPSCFLSTIPGQRFRNVSDIHDPACHGSSLPPVLKAPLVRSGGGRVGPGLMAGLQVVRKGQVGADA